MKEWINRMTGRIRNHIVIASTVLAFSLMALGAVTDLVVDENGICSRAVNFINQIKISHALYLNQSAVYNYEDNAVIELVGTVAGTGNLINGSDAKTTPVDADNVAITNSADSHKLGKTTWANIKATLKSYFDGLYQALLPSQTGNSGKFLTTNGSALSWGAVASVTQSIYNYTQDFTINSALNGALITNHGATTDITGTFASGLSAGFWVDVANEVQQLDLTTVLMLRMENNANDGSAINHTPTASNITYSSSVKKYGTYSAVFASNSSISFTTSTYFNFGSGNFTAQGWFRFSDLTGWQGLMGTYWSNGGGWALYKAGTTNALMFVYTSGSNKEVSKDWSPSVDTWYHIAVCRNGADVRIFVDGTQLGTTGDMSTDSIAFSSYGFAVGMDGVNGTAHFLGYADNIRLDKGSALFTDTFTPVDYPSAKITLAPASGKQLPGTTAADNTLISLTKGDVKNFFNTGNSWISKYTTGTWIDGL